MYCQNIFFLTKHCTDYSVHFHNVLSSRVNHTLNKTAMMHLYPCLVQCQLANRMLSWCAISAESSWCGFILQALNLLRYIDGLCLVALPAGDGYVYVWVGILLIGKQRDKGKKKKKKGPTSSCLWFQAHRGFSSQPSLVERSVKYITRFERRISGLSAKSESGRKRLC